MADHRSFQPTPGTLQANRAVEQGQGVGRMELDAQRDPSRHLGGLDPQRQLPFDAPERPRRDGDGRLASRKPARSLAKGPEIGDVAQGDNPEEDWGEPADEGATYSANHTRRPAKTEADRGQGKKTRAARKDQFSRRV
jgi:hypothetical protein